MKHNKEKNEEYTQLTLDDINEGTTENTEVVDENEEVTEKEISTEPNAVISGCPKLNIRKSNSKDSEVLIVLEEGTELFAAEIDDEWMMVVTSAGLEGCAMKKFIKMK